MYASGKDFSVAQWWRLAYRPYHRKTTEKGGSNRSGKGSREGEQEKRRSGFRQFLLVRCITIIDNYNLYEGHQGLNITLDSFYLPIVQRLHWILENSKNGCNLGPTPGQSHLLTPAWSYDLASKCLQGPPNGPYVAPRLKPSGQATPPGPCFHLFLTSYGARMSSLEVPKGIRRRWHSTASISKLTRDGSPL